MSPLKQADQYPGSLTRAVNFETSREGGGYRRCSGYQKFDESPVPGTGPVLGSFVFDGQVIGCRGDKISISGASGWTELNSGDLNTNAQKYEGRRYNWGFPAIILVDTTNQPFRYANGTLTRLTNLPTGINAVQEFKRHMFYAAGNRLIFSSPNDETDITPANGAGEINVGFSILGLGVWRDELYVFGRNAISKIIGNNSTDFTLKPTTSRIGCVHRDTIKELGGDLVFLADDGVRTIAGTEKIGDVELGSISSAIYRDMYKLPGEYSAGTFSSAIVAEKSQYRLLPSVTTGAVEDATGYVGCIVTNPQGGIGYEWFQLQGIKASSADSDYFDNVEIIVHGGYDGYIYQQERGNSLDGRDIVAYMEIPYITYGDPRIRKTLHTITAYANIEGAVDIAANIIFDYNSAETVQPAETNLTSNIATFATFGNAVFGSDVFGAASDITLTSNIVGSGYTASARISSTNTKASYTVEELVFEYATYSRR